MTSASVTDNTGACSPVRSCCLRAQIRNAIAPTIADNKRDLRSAEPVFENRCRQEQAAIVEKDAPADRNAVADIGQRLEHGVVPEQQLQQQRQVANHLDVTGCKLSPAASCCDSRDMPTTKPRMVASTMPIPATSSVLSSPTQNARP